MKALTFHGDRTVRCETVSDPTIQRPDDALVRVRLCSVCGSDLHVYHGRERGLDHGCVMGHEFVGEVVEAGPACEGLSAGRRVLSPFTTSCGRCGFCRIGLTSRCARGQLFGWVEGGNGLQGGQAEYVRVPLAATTLLPVPEDVDDETALLLGDVLSTGFFCARQAGLSEGEVAVVVGCGPVGLCAVIGAFEYGASRVFALDRVSERLALAERFGATPLHVDRDDVAAEVYAVTEGRGADAALEVVGNAEAHRAALGLLRAGGTLSVVGVHNEPAFSFSPAEAYDKNLTYRVGRCPARRMAEELLPLVRSKDLGVSALFTHRLPLDEGVEAYRIFDEKADGCIKTALNPG